YRYTGKGGKERQRALPPPVQQAILAYARAAGLARKPEEAVFPGRWRDQPVDGKYIGETRWSPQPLLRSWATRIGGGDRENWRRPKGATAAPRLSSLWGALFGRQRQDHDPGRPPNLHCRICQRGSWCHHEAAARSLEEESLELD